MKDFFTRLFDPNVSQGAKDYYAVMLFFDILCFLTIAAGINSFGVSAIAVMYCSKMLSTISSIV